MPKKKQVHLTTEQILEQTRRNAERQEKLKFVREVFYPALTKATTSIDDALTNLSIISTVIMEKFLGKMKEVTMKEVDVYSNLSKDDPQYESLKAMLELFDNMNTFEAKEHFEYMRQEIQLFLNDEQKERTLDSLKTKWLGEK